MTHWGQVGVELQGPHWQQGSLGIPWQPQPLAPWSQEKFQLWLYKDRRRNLLLYPPWSWSQAFPAQRVLQILASGLVEMGGEGWAPAALGHGRVLQDFKQCTFTKIFSLLKAGFACQLLNHTQHSEGSHVSLTNHLWVRNAGSKACH